MIKFDFTSYMTKLDQIDSYNEKIEDIKNKLSSGTKLLGWYNFDQILNIGLLDDIVKTSNYIRSNCDVFIVIGIGGSFLGAKAVIDALTPYFDDKKPEIIFAGTSLSGSYLKELADYIKDKDVIVNVISKSGDTLEPNIAFDYLYELLADKYNDDEIMRRVIITTGKAEGHLNELVEKYNYKYFEVPEEVGGRYSVFTAVGLLPIAVAGINIYDLLDGARSVCKEDAYKYAVIRDCLNHKGKLIESFTVYEPKLLYFTEWLKQLFAETQGKERKGLFPVASINTRDLHSLGQFYQDGTNIIFETVININNTTYLYIPKYKITMDNINNIAAHKVAEAHYQADTYSNFIDVDSLNAYNLGYLIYFFELAAATGGYLLDIYPFDQPGVNAYKDLISKELDKDDINH